mmetsp:Transcript_43565/g.128261  ORF Transcript_43565/g.128261 Transcript_43565/m.128261 type:complete len:209 (-) Transcript_43565:662-1288(-)
MRIRRRCRVWRTSRAVAAKSISSYQLVWPRSGPHRWSQDDHRWANGQRTPPPPAPRRPPGAPHTRADATRTACVHMKAMVGVWWRINGPTHASSHRDVVSTSGGHKMTTGGQNSSHGSHEGPPCTSTELLGYSHRAWSHSSKHASEQRWTLHWAHANLVVGIRFSSAFTRRFLPSATSVAEIACCAHWRSKEANANFTRHRASKTLCS